MAGTEERYSLEEILAEFKQPEGAQTSRRTEQKASPAAKPAPTSKPAAEPAISEEEMRSQEAALAAKMRARQQMLEQQAAAKKPSAEETIRANIAQARAEKAQRPVEEHKPDLGQVTMKFAAVPEMTRKAAEAPKMPEEAKPEPLTKTNFNNNRICISKNINKI